MAAINVFVGFLLMVATTAFVAISVVSMTILWLVCLFYFGLRHAIHNAHPAVLVGVVLSLGLFIVSVKAQPVAVDVALVLAVDVSSSMDAEERQVQREGYAAALTSKEVMHAIQMNHHRRIAVTYLTWATPSEQVVVVPWTILDSPESAKRVANQILNQDFTGSGTSVWGALSKSAELLQTAPQANRRVVDISGDGTEQHSLVQTFREKLIKDGVTINGLPLMFSPSDHDVEQFYEECVIGGENAFTIPVRALAEFERALKMKLIMEIADLQKPVTVKPVAYQAMKCAY